MAWLNVAEIGVLTATAVAPFAGIVETTVGGTAVVKVHAKLAASAAPAGSLAPVVIVAVYKVPVARKARWRERSCATGVSDGASDGALLPGPVKVNVAAVNRRRVHGLAECSGDCRVDGHGRSRVDWNCGNNRGWRSRCEGPHKVGCQRRTRRGLSRRW